MSKKLNLSNLKDRIFNKKKKSNPEDKFIRLAELIVACGGYQNFMETPVAAIMEIDRMLDKQKEEQSKMFQGITGGLGK